MLSLKTISQLSEENDHKPLFVRNPDWKTHGYFFYVNSIQRNKAYGDVYCLNDFGTFDIKSRVTYPSDVPRFYAVSADLEQGFVVFDSSTRIAALEFSKNQRKNCKNKSVVKIGSTVILVDIHTDEIRELTIVSSSSNIRYKTMGYKTKKYAEIVPVSDADGLYTISDISPLGRAILGKRVGDEIAFSAPEGVQQIKILSICQN